MKPPTPPSPKVEHPTGEVWGYRGGGEQSWVLPVLGQGQEATSVTLAPITPSPAPDEPPGDPVRAHPATDPTLVPETPEPGPALPDQEVL